MNSKKKQTVAVAMATAISVSTMMSPVAVHALKEDPTIAITQETVSRQIQEVENSTQDQMIISQNDSAQQKDTENKSLVNAQNQLVINSLSSQLGRSEDDAFTNEYDALDAIEKVLDAFEYSNETTHQELQDFLNQEFVVTGKLKEVYVSDFIKTDATTTSTGHIQINYNGFLMNGNFIAIPRLIISLIPRLPIEGEVVINSKNFPDPTFRKCVKDQFDKDDDSVLSQDEISEITEVDVSTGRDIKSLKGIEYFTALKVLNCSNTGILELDVNNNLNLEGLLCNNTALISLNVNNNPNLLDLYCFKTRITSLDISNNRNLEYLYCDNTDILELNTNNNLYLKSLLCDNTEITSLDVSNNSRLRRLECSNTRIQSLDVSNNTNLKYLYCENTPLAWLKLGTDNILEELKKSDSHMNINVTDRTFNIAHMFKGIDSTKINENTVTGAIYNKDTGIMSNYSLDTPITYEYDCGIVQGVPQILKVTLNLSKSDSKIIIENSLDREYTGKPYEIPEIKTEGSKGELTFTYSQYINGNYERIETAPTNVGKYAVYIELAEDEYNNGAVIEQTFFEIRQAQNSWINELDIKDWKVGDNPNAPIVTAKFGDVVFTYSNFENGTYTSQVPTQAGTWYVKATVVGTENYTGLKSIRAFTIQKQDNPANSDNQLKKEPEDIVKTRDNRQIGMLSTLAMMSGGCIIILTGKKKRYETERRSRN